MANTTAPEAPTTAQITPAHFPQTYAFPLPDFVDELRFAHRIIGNALRVMTLEQKVQWAELNHIDGVDGEGATRAHERLALFAQTPEALPIDATPPEQLPPHVAYLGHWRYVTQQRFPKRTSHGPAYVMAVALGPHDTVLMSTADPAWRLQELARTLASEARRYADGYVPPTARSAVAMRVQVGVRQFDRVALTAPIDNAQKMVCDVLESLSGQRQMRLLHEPLEKVVALLSEKIGGAS